MQTACEGKRTWLVGGNSQEVTGAGVWEWWVGSQGGENENEGVGRSQSL